jgi:hypothetical protein
MAFSESPKCPYQNHNDNKAAEAPSISGFCRDPASVALAWTAQTLGIFKPSSVHNSSSYSARPRPTKVKAAASATATLLPTRKFYTKKKRRQQHPFIGNPRRNWIHNGVERNKNLHTLHSFSAWCAIKIEPVKILTRDDLWARRRYETMAPNRMRVAKNPSCWQCSAVR